VARKIAPVPGQGILGMGLSTCGAQPLRERAMRRI